MLVGAVEIRKGGHAKPNQISAMILNVLVEKLMSAWVFYGGVGASDGVAGLFEAFKGLVEPRAFCVSTKRLRSFLRILRMI